MLESADAFCVDKPDAASRRIRIVRFMDPPGYDRGRAVQPPGRAGSCLLSSHRSPQGRSTGGLDGAPSARSTPGSLHITLGAAFFIFALGIAGSFDVQFPSSSVIRAR